MAKNLKLNIKNAQIAEALKKLNKKKPSSAKGKTAPKKTKKVKTEDATQKPKARILPPKKEEVKQKPKVRILPPKKEKVEEKAKVEQQPKPPILPQKKQEEVKEEKKVEPQLKATKEVIDPKKKEEKAKVVEKPKEKKTELPTQKKGFKPYKDFRAAKKPQVKKSFDSQDRLGLRSYDERWRKKRAFKHKRKFAEIPIVRPSSLKVKIPITLKDLASMMKLKGSELISKLFMQGIVITLNDYLEDETTIQLLGQEFNCDIAIDVEEEKKLRITDMTIKQEIQNTPSEKLVPRPPVITFMGHVDHGKTSLIDAIRKSNITAAEAGAITQHIGAFIAKTSFGNVTILDTPGHEAFTEMRLRGASVTDIVILVIAGDEGMRDQTVEALNQAKEAQVPIVVAINKSDKAGFDQEKVYRQLADQELLPEAWGGTTITINCSAQTKEGVSTLLEMVSLQAEILELKANPHARARGTTLESEMHKGLGAAATVLVQNGTLKLGDAIVFGNEYGRIKTMHDQYDKNIKEAAPSVPVMITGLSNLAQAGSEFIVVENEKQARELASARGEKIQRRALQQKKLVGIESLVKQEKKVLPIIIRTDVQGSLEALKSSLLKIQSDKVEINIISSEVGEISESDVMLAAASKAVILGFHTNVESHAEPMIKQQKVIVRLHNIIYHAIDEIKVLMQSILDKVAKENEIGEANVIALFKSSQLGTIAGCMITEGVLKRNCFVRILRDNEVIFNDKISSLKRVNDDVKEVAKGFECGVLFEKFSDIQKDDVLQAYDITYIEQEI